VVVTLNTTSGAPALGAVVSLRVDVRDSAGIAIGDPIIIPVNSSASTFNVDVETTTGEGRQITVLAIGDRPVTGGPDGPDAGIGVLYRGFVSGVDVFARANSARAMSLDAFVPQFHPLETVSSGVRVTWTAQAGVSSYQLTRFYDGVGFMTTPATGTSFVDDTGASRYQVVAVEKSGRRSAPSDFLEGQ
jgi:hypothetical protein